MSANAFVSALLKGFASVGQPVTKALAPLADTPPSTDALAAFLREFGWTLAPGSDPAAIAAAFGALETDVNSLVTDAQLLSDGSSDDEIAAVVSDVAQLLTQIGNLAAGFGSVNFAPFDNHEFQTTFPNELWPYLLHRYLRDHVSVLYGVLRFLGILTETAQAAAATGRSAYVKHDVDWSRIPQYASQPGATFAGIYHWGDTTAPFDHVAFMQGLGALVGGFPLASQIDAPSSDLQDLFYPAGAPPNLLQLTAAPVPALEISGPVEVFLKLMLGVIPVPVSGGTPPDPTGLALFPILVGAATSTIQISDGFSVEIGGHFQAIPVIVEFRPTATGGVQATLSPLTLNALSGETKIGATLKLKASSTTDSPWILIGRPTTSHLQLASAHLGVDASGAIDAIEYKLEAGFDALKLVIDLSDADGFVKSVADDKAHEIDLSCTVNWSRRTGFSVNGQAQLAAIIPLHITLADVVELDSIEIAAAAGSDQAGASLVAGLTGGLMLGPVAASVDRIGVQVNVKKVPTGGKGNLGDLDLQFQFHPPKGLGLVIDAGVVVGGGYIFCDPDKGQYAGVLELAIEVVQVKIIGILNTILPGGQQGFSLLLIVSAEFEPIQLAFGFTLSGVGGLAGINRTMVLDALRTGLKNHTLNSILFPVNPVAHAAQIISDLQAVFPPQQNRYVFGPMVQFGWGTPNLIIAELGIVLELPAPIRLAILGKMTAALPDPDAAVVLIHLDVLGTVDFEKKYLTIDATLYDSRVAAFTLLGDMALRMLWGENANFALSVGGLHPKFQPPPSFPHLTRLMLSLGSGDNPRLSCDAYFAVTSNSVQFGAGVSLHASAAGFSVEGYLGFDALFIISPFHFSVLVAASVDLKQGSTSLMSVSLNMLLDGPNPWHAAGTASAHILFITVSVGFDHTWGDPNQVSLPGEDPTPKLLAALSDIRSWNAALPSDAERAASLVAPAPDSKTVVVHPLGKLGVTQKILPLGLRLTRFGSAAPIGVDQFDIGDVTMNGHAVPKTGYTTIAENFAPGQFQELSDDAKLSRPSFEPHSAGVQLTADAVATGTVQPLDVDYETILVDDPLLPGSPVGLYPLNGVVLLAQAGQGAAQFSGLRNTGKRKFLDPEAVDGAVRVGHVKYGVTNKKDLSTRRDISQDGSFSSVQQDLDSYLEQNPGERDDLQVTPAHQTARV